MSALLTLRQAVIDALKASLGKSWDVAGHLGRFAPADLNQFLTRAPAVRVAVLGLEAGAIQPDGDAMTTTVRLGIYVVTKDHGARLAREEIAVAAVETITLMAFGNRWGVPGVKPAGAPNAQTIFNGDTVAKGVALWAIDLPQPIVIERPEGETNPLSELFLGIAPNIGAAHEDDYLGPIQAEDIPDV